MANSRIVNPEAVENPAALPKGAASPALASGNDANADANNDAAAKSASGKQYRVAHTSVGVWREGDELDRAALDGVDVQRLLDLGAIEELQS